MADFVVGNFVEADFAGFAGGFIFPKTIGYLYRSSTCTEVIVVYGGWLFFLKNCKLELGVSGGPMVGFEHEEDTFEDQFREFNTILSG